MESRSRRRRRSSGLQLGSPGNSSGGGEDHISALPDDLLLLILARLGCARTAARTSVLSRRWRSGQLWTRLPALVFHDVTVPSLEAALGRVSRLPPAVSLLEIRFAKQRKPVPKTHHVDNARLNSLFRAAAQLEPEELIFDLPYRLVQIGSLDLDLPCLHRATSITFHTGFGYLRVPAGIEFPALETLSLSGCSIDVNALLSRCPRLRTLRLRGFGFPKINSASLQELVVMHSTIGISGSVYNFDIVTPQLKKLTVSLNLWEARISILAPILEKVSWRCYLYGPFTQFGWRLMQLSLHTPERKGQLPSLQLYARHSSCITFDGEGTNITQEIEKHMIADFSVLEIHLTTKGHVFGGLVSDLLGINRICTSTQRLKVVLKRSVDEEECPLDCPCDSPNWRSQTRYLTALEEVEINGFEGDEHETDFLKLIFKCAPILKKMVVKLSDEASSTNFGRRKMNHIFRAWSSTGFYVHSASNEYIFHRID